MIVEEMATEVEQKTPVQIEVRALCSAVVGGPFALVLTTGADGRYVMPDGSLSRRWMGTARAFLFEGESGLPAALADVRVFEAQHNIRVVNYPEGLIAGEGG